MADRAAAYLFSEVFTLIDKHVPTGDRLKVARQFWKKSLDYDFTPREMENDRTLARLNLAVKGVDPSSPEDGKVWLYLGDAGFDDALASAKETT